MPRPRYTPTTDDQARVRELAAIGMSDDDIASQLGLPVPRLQKIFRLELKQGAAAGREHALNKLHTIALSGENVTALHFWVKARCGWRDTGPAQNAASAITRITLFKQASEPQPNPASSPDPHQPHDDSPHS